MALKLVVLCWWCVVLVAAAASPQRHRGLGRVLLQRQHRQQQRALDSEPSASSSSSSCKYTLHHFNQTLNHFDPSDDRTFQQRYLVYDEEWLVTRKGPILLYTGNEGDIIWFCKNTVRIFVCTYIMTKM